MSDYNYGPISTYEVVWRSGHVEQVQAHQCLLPRDSSFDITPEASKTAPRYLFHGVVNGRWMLILSVLESDILSVRLVTVDEHA